MTRTPALAGCPLAGAGAGGARKSVGGPGAVVPSAGRETIKETPRIEAGRG